MAAAKPLSRPPDAAVVVKEVWQLLVSDGCAAFAAVDTAFVASAQLLQQWTQPCGALRKWTSSLR